MADQVENVLARLLVPDNSVIQQVSSKVYRLWRRITNRMTTFHSAMKLFLSVKHCTWSAQECQQSGKLDIQFSYANAA